MAYKKVLETENVKITVEEIRSGERFIATLWDKGMDAEIDREVYEFETYGGACDKALDLVQEWFCVG